MPHHPFPQRMIAVLILGVSLCTAACGSTTIVITGGTTPTAAATDAPGGMPTPVSPTATSAPPTAVPPTSVPPTAILPTPTPHTPATTHLVFAQLTLTGSAPGPVTVSCPAGEVALGGGWATSGFGTVYNSSRSGNGWQVYVNHTGNDLVNAYVMCLVHNPSAVVTQRLKQLSVPAGSSSTDVYAPCNAGEVPVGGGFALSTGIELHITNSSVMNKGWEVNVANKTGSALLVNAYAMCLMDNLGFLGPNGPTIGVNPGTSQSSTSTCPAGFQVTGGGYQVDQQPGSASPPNIFNSSPTSSGWETYLNEASSGAKTYLTGYAQCYQFT